MGCKGENLEIVGDVFCGVLCISCKMLLTRFRVLEGGLGRDDNEDGVQGGVNCFLGDVRFLKVIKTFIYFTFLSRFLSCFLRRFRFLRYLF